MTKPACKDCRFWNHDTRYQTEIGDADLWTSQCQRNPPTITKEEVDGDNCLGSWPRTRHSMWCGEFKSRARTPISAEHVDFSSLRPWSEFWDSLSVRCKNAIAREAEERKLRLGWETWTDLMVAKWAASEGAVDWGSRKSVRRCIPAMRNFGEVCTDEVIGLMADCGWPFRD